jgi:hypothetical protein
LSSSNAHLIDHAAFADEDIALFAEHIVNVEILWPSRGSAMSVQNPVVPSAQTIRFFHRPIDGDAVAEVAVSGLWFAVSPVLSGSASTRPSLPTWPGDLA